MAKKNLKVSVQIMLFILLFSGVLISLQMYVDQTNTANRQKQKSSTPLTARTPGNPYGDAPLGTGEDNYRDTADANPQVLSEATESNEPITPDSLNVLVDKDHALPQDYSPKDLVKVADYGINTEGLTQYLRKPAAESLQVMLTDMKKNNMNISVISAYRSYQTQVGTYNKWVRELGQTKADQTSARPGHSEHQLGTTVDISLAGSGSNLSSIYPGQPTPAWRWLDLNAHKYGFVMSYRFRQESDTGYKFEPWHWRYVGKELAIKIRTSTNTPQSFYEPLD